MYFDSILGHVLAPKTSHMLHHLFTQDHILCIHGNSYGRYAITCPLHNYMYPPVTTPILNKTTGTILTSKHKFMV